MKFVVILIIYSSISLALDAIEMAYEKSDKSSRIRCEFEDKSNHIISIKAVGPQKFSPGKSFFQKFKLITQNADYDYSINVFVKNNKAMFELDFDGNKQVGKVEEGNNRYLKKQMKFEGEMIDNLSCFMEFATEPLIDLSDGKYHINVHPHQNFDVRSGSIKAIDEVYNDDQLRHLLLLEDNNYKESKVNLINYLKTGKINIVKTIASPIIVKFTPSTKILVSPSGVNRYNLKAKDEISLLYTGGNHNYCIFQNIQKVLESLLISNESPVLNINFKSSAIVVQKAGAADGLSFSRWGKIRYTNLFSNLMKDKSIFNSYHKSYFYYFSDIFFKKYSHRFQKIILNYDAGEFKKQKMIQGQGERTLQINFKYN